VRIGGTQPAGAIRLSFLILELTTAMDAPSMCFNVSLGSLKIQNLLFGSFVA
jgi:hypothetical protein